MKMKIQKSIRPLLAALLTCVGAGAAGAETLTLPAARLDPPAAEGQPLVWAGLGFDPDGVLAIAQHGEACEIRSRFLCDAPEADGVRCHYVPVDWECREVRRIRYRLPATLTVSKADHEIRLARSGAEPLAIADFSEIGSKQYVFLRKGVELRFRTDGAVLVLDLAALVEARAAAAFPKLYGTDATR